MSDAGTSRSGRNDVKWPLKRAGELVVQESRVHEKQLV